MLGTRAMNQLRAVMQDVVVVVNDTTEDIYKNLDVTLVSNNEPMRGLGHSIRCGVEQTCDRDGWLILPADLPVIEANTIAEVARVLSTCGGIVRPYYRGEPGHPVGFDRTFGAALSKLDGEHAGRDLIECHADMLTKINSDDAGAVRDVDQPRDIQRLTAANGPGQLR